MGDGVVTMLKTVRCALDGIYGSYGSYGGNAHEDGKGLGPGLGEREVHVEDVGSGMLLQFDPLCPIYPEEPGTEPGSTHTHTSSSKRMFDYEVHNHSASNTNTNNTSTGDTHTSHCACAYTLLIALHREIYRLYGCVGLDMGVGDRDRVGVGGSTMGGVTGVGNSNSNSNSIPVDHYSKLPVVLQQVCVYRYVYMCIFV